MIITRIDTFESCMTLFKCQDENHSQEIYVPIWIADDIENTIANLTQEQLMQLYNLEQTKVINS